jgi:hypothetical protein
MFQEFDSYSFDSFSKYADSIATLLRLLVEGQLAILVIRLKALGC